MKHNLKAEILTTTIWLVKDLRVLTVRVNLINFSNNKYQNQTAHLEILFQTYDK